MYQMKISTPTLKSIIFLLLHASRQQNIFLFTLRSSSTADFSLTGIDGSDSMNLYVSKVATERGVGVYLIVNDLVSS